MKLGQTDTLHVEVLMSQPIARAFVPDPPKVSQAKYRRDIEAALNCLSVDVMWEWERDWARKGYRVVGWVRLDYEQPTDQQIITLEVPNASQK